ncbi:XkdX family protein [Virgibacillus sp. Bac332]|nr:XkdX family protein [Virgibacillus sp. Bac332]
MFESLKERYAKNWCRKDQLKRFVELEAITEAEYALITGEPYSTDEA